LLISDFLGLVSLPTNSITPRVSNPPNKLYTTTQHAMPKNKGKGGKNRRRGKNENESEKRELIYKEEEDQGRNTNALLSLQ